MLKKNILGIQNVSFTYQSIISIILNTNPSELCGVKLCEELFINNQYGFTPL